MHGAIRHTRDRCGDRRGIGEPSHDPRQKWRGTCITRHAGSDSPEPPYSRLEQESGGQSQHEEIIRTLGCYLSHWQPFGAAAYSILGIEGGLES